MNDALLQESLQQVAGQDPPERFVDELRAHLFAEADSSHGGDIHGVMIDLDRQRGTYPRRRGPIVPLVAALVLLLGIVGVARLVATDSDTAQLQTAGAVEQQDIGVAWLDSIVANDRDAFAALHATAFEANDTPMAYSADVGILTSERIAELYIGGFDALQASLAAGHEVRSEGCRDRGTLGVRCSYTLFSGGNAEYTSRVQADLVIEKALITSITYTTSTRPFYLRTEIDNFMAEAATDEDRACLALGFNTVGCGSHEVDFLSRYIAFYEAAHDEAGD